jgi:hypothetical protein
MAALWGLSLFASRRDSAQMISHQSIPPFCAPLMGKPSGRDQSYHRQQTGTCEAPQHTQPVYISSEFDC